MTKEELTGYSDYEMSFINYINETKMLRCPFSHIRKHFCRDWSLGQKPFTNTRGNSYVCSVLDNTEEFGLIERLFAAKIVRVKRNPKELESFFSPYGEVRIQEVLAFPIGLPGKPELPALFANCYYDFCGAGAGFHVYGYDGKDMSASYYHSFCKYMDELLPTRIDSKNVPRDELFDLEDVLEDESLEYCSYVPNNCAIKFPEYAKVFRKHPICEMFAKLGLFGFCKSERNIALAEKNKAFLKFIHRNIEQIKKHWHSVSFSTCWGAFKHNEDIFKYRERVLKKNIVARTLCDGLYDKQKEAYKQAMKFTTQEKLLNWINTNGVCHDNRTYFDYLEAAMWLKLDFSDTKVLFPKNFQEVHDDYCKQYEDWQEEQRQIELAKIEKKRIRTEKTKASRMQANAEKARKFLEFRQNGFFVIVAQSKQELIDEGEAQHNCVGRMSYFDKQADGQSVICFIRKENEPEKSLITAEVNLKGGLKISQFYLARNQPASEYDWFADAWIESMKRLKKNKC